jgi:hypothetical protein
MKYFTKSTLVFFFCLLALQSCEYQSEKDYFVNVEPPPSTHNINLTLSSSSDTIRIYCPTTLIYDINTFGLKILGGFFSLPIRNGKLNPIQGVSPFHLKIFPQGNTSWY